MRKMLEMWGDSAVVIHLDLSTGNYIEGLVKEVDRDEVVVEPVYEDGSVGALAVINLNHVVMAYYDETPPDSIDDPVTEAVVDRRQHRDDPTTAEAGPRSPPTLPEGPSDLGPARLAHGALRRNWREAIATVTTASTSAAAVPRPTAAASTSPLNRDRVASTM